MGRINCSQGKTNFSYELSVKSGSITIMDKQYTNTSKKNLQLQTPHYTINCDMGTIIIT